MNAQARMLAMASVFTGASLQAQGARGDDGQLVSRNACRLHSLDHVTYSGEYRRDQNVEVAAIDSAFRTLRRPTAADSSEYRRSRDDAAAGQPIPEARYDLLFRSGRYQCERIGYRSDGLKVIG